MVSRARATVGVLMLDTAFERFPRDIGHAASLPFPTIRYRVDGATVDTVVRGARLPVSTRMAFLAGAHALVARGARLVTSSCGFLHREQAALQAALSVPVVSSALLALPRLRRRHGAYATLGVLSFDRAALGPLDHDGPLAIEGIDPDSHFAAVIRGETRHADRERMSRDVALAAERLAAHGPAAVVLECTNLAPFRERVETACGVETIDLVDEIERVLSS